jgi:hypothetical protein
VCLSDSYSMLPPTYGNSFRQPFLIHLKPRTWLWRWVILDGLLKRLLTVSASPGHYSHREKGQFAFILPPHA